MALWNNRCSCSHRRRTKHTPPFMCAVQRFELPDPISVIALVPILRTTASWIFRTKCLSVTTSCASAERTASCQETERQSNFDTAWSFVQSCFRESHLPWEWVITVYTVSNNKDVGKRMVQQESTLAVVHCPDKSWCSDLIGPACGEESSLFLSVLRSTKKTGLTLFSKTAKNFPFAESFQVVRVFSVICQDGEWRSSCIMHFICSYNIFLFGVDSTLEADVCSLDVSNFTVY